MEGAALVGGVSSAKESEGEHNNNTTVIDELLENVASFTAVVYERLNVGSGFRTAVISSSSPVGELLCAAFIHVAR